MKRPILPILIFFILGILTHEFILINLNFMVFACLFLCLFYSKVGKKSILFLGVFIVSVFLTSIRYPKDIAIESNRKKENFVGHIYSKKITEQGYIYYVKLSNPKLNVEVYSKENFDENNKINIYGFLESPSGKNNFKTFNKERYLKSKNIFFKLNTKNINLVEKETYIKYKIKSYISDFYKKNLDNLSFQFVNSMILGYKGDEELFDVFKELGLSHLLAISGLHLNVLIGFLDKIGNKLNLKKKYYSIFIIVSLLFYGYIIDFPVSLIRALTMYILSTIAIYTNNIKDDLNSIFVSIFICLIINPFNIYSTAFYLSFAAIISVYYFTKKIKKIFFRIPDAFTAAISIQIGMFPIMTYFFNSINLLTFLINILIIPMISLVLSASVAYLFVRINLIKYFIEGVFYIISKISFPFFSVSDLFRINFSSFDLWEIFLYYSIFIIIFNYRIIIYKITKNKNLLIYSILIPLIAIKIIFLPIVTINIIDVGQGDSILLRSNNKNVMVDTGGSALTPDISGKDLYQYLIKNKVSNIHHLFISHSDLDHVGNLDYLIDKIKIYNIYSNDEIKYMANYVKKHSKFSVGNINLTTIMNGDQGKTSNDKSLVLLVEVFGRTLLLTGDIENGEQKIKISPHIDFLKVSHHGSKHSTKEEFLENNDIKFALISAGRNNIYGHPTKETLERLEKENAKIYRTDLDGNIEIRINPLGFVIKTYKGKIDIFEWLYEILLF